MPDEKVLIAQLKNGDSEALSAVFDAYSDKIYRLAISLLHDEQSADGVVQDTFIALIEHIDTFEGRASIGTWLYRVAYNNCMTRLRKHNPQIDIDSLEEDNFAAPEVFYDWQALPEQMLTSGEAMDQVQSALEEISPTLRVVFVLRDIEQFSTEETAQALGITTNAVKVRLHRARLALREKLAKYFEEMVT